MTIRKFTDRTRIITEQRCSRKRWLEYEEGPSRRGIQPARVPLPLLVGSAVHAGLAVLLREGQEQWDEDKAAAGYWSTSTIEEHAVAAALADFSASATEIELDSSETAAMQPTPAAELFTRQMIQQARELGMPTEGLGGVSREAAAGEFDRYLRAEQRALVEGLVRAYARRRLRPLLEQFEVLEVEREGSWKLSEWAGEFNPTGVVYEGSMRDPETLQPWTIHEHEQQMIELWFMSRPDALLRERQSNELYLQSYKTTGQWDTRKERDIQHDMQGLSEGVEVERRLGEWWQALHRINAEKWDDSRIKRAYEAGELKVPDYGDAAQTKTMGRFLMSLSAPPRIHAIRYEHLLKGYRDEDRELTSRLGMTVYTQRTHLIRQYVATSTPKRGEGGYRVGDVAWSWNYYRPEDDKDSKLAWQNWQARPVWEAGTVKDWIDALDAAEILMSGQDSTVGLEPRVLGWKSPAQSLGVTKEHPLESAFVAPQVVYRSDDELRDWVEEVEHQEREAAVHAAEVHAAQDPGERRHLLNIYFPKVRSACQYPSQCAFARDRVGICWAGAEMQAAPLEVGGGEYKERVPNHPVESQVETLPVDINK